MKFVIIFLLLMDITYAKIPQVYKKAKFNQERYLKSSNLTLKSSGFVFINEKEEYFWVQEKPFAMETVISNGQVFNIENGKRKLISNPFMENLYSIFNQLFKGDDKALSKSFNISQPSPNKYILTPNDKLLGKAIKKLSIEGRKNIHKFELFETSGNRLDIRFLEVNQSPMKKNEKK